MWSDCAHLPFPLSFHPHNHIAIHDSLLHHLDFRLIGPRIREWGSSLTRTGWMMDISRLS